MTTKDWIVLLIPILCNIILVGGAGTLLKSYIDKQLRKNDRSVENSLTVMNELLNYLEKIKKSAIDITFNIADVTDNKLEKQIQNMYILGGNLQTYIENHDLYLANHKKNIFLYNDLLQLLETFRSMGRSQSNHPDKFAKYFNELQEQCTHIINGYNKYISEN